MVYRQKERQELKKIGNRRERQSVNIKGDNIKSFYLLDFLSKIYKIIIKDIYFFKYEYLFIDKITIFIYK